MYLLPHTAIHFTQIQLKFKIKNKTQSEPAVAQWTYTTILFLLDLLVLPEICSFLLHIPPAHRKEITCFQAGVLWPQRAERRWRKWEEEREGKGGVKNETWLSGPFTHSSSPASALCSPLWTDWTFKYVHIMCLWLNRHTSLSPQKPTFYIL